ncbi:N-6 DNA methylase [Brachybacterium sp. DNPG3]
MSTAHPGDDTAELRKARGAFFTPAPISRYIAEWAIQSGDDRVLEPSAGDAEFMLAAAARLQELNTGSGVPVVEGVEIHESSATVGRERVMAAGAEPSITVSDFFDIPATPSYDAVIGNPPYIRYQEFAGESRAKARAAALAGGVGLSGLASSWAAFTVHSARFLRHGGRLGLVLPAELLSVNYAAPVRKYLFENFREVSLVLFEHQVFPEAEADVVLLLADGYGHGPTDSATFRQTTDANTLGALDQTSTTWTPITADAKWTGSLVEEVAADAVADLRTRGTFSELQTWGETTLGIVTGNNKYFAMSPERVKQQGLKRNETLPLSPPGSAHLRGLALTTSALRRLGAEGKATRLFRPAEQHSTEAELYIQAGEQAGVHLAYKCRVRRVWYQPPVVPPADLLLTYMNADTARITTNEAGAHHLNSVHGVYLNEEYRELGRELLPLASLNSVTLLHAELVGRAYGGGILKIEPREADQWLLPSPQTVASHADELRAVKARVTRLLGHGDLTGAVEAVNDVLFAVNEELDSEALLSVMTTREMLASRRASRGASGR